MSRRIKYSNTKPERVVAAFLRKLKLPFKAQFFIPGLPHPFDFGLPRYKLLIECDGCWWHGCKIHCPRSRFTQVRDRATDRRARRLGWRVLRIWEHDIYKLTASNLLTLMRIT